MDTAAAARDRLKSQRDRFLAFAFAGADMLVEMEADGRITFVAGASEKVIGLANDALADKSFFALLEPQDRAMATEALRRLENGSRLERLRMDFLCGGAAVACFVSAINLRGDDGRLHLAVSRDRAPEERRGIRPVPLAGLAALTEKRVHEAKRGGDVYSLTLIALPPGAAGDHIAGAIEGRLRAWSIGGDSVARVDSGELAVIHDSAIDDAVLRECIAAALEGIEAEPPKLGSLPLDADLGSQDLLKALTHAIARFAEGDGPGPALSLAYKAAMGETMAKVSNFRSLIGGAQFCFAFQPIVCLTNWNAHHYEALARIHQGDRFVLPARFLSFAEDAGIVTEFDWVVCNKAMQVLRDNTGIPPAAHLAINLSGQSLTNARFVNELLMLLRENQWQIPRLLFEITGSTSIANLGEANKVVQKLRAFGCRFCLDDFGAGAATFQYLRALDLDFVKIDGSYILDAFDSRHGKPFLRAMANVCAELGIRTIGEMVEDEKAVQLLGELQINYGQGYYFAKPNVDATRLALPTKPFGRVFNRVVINAS